jgi:DNA repair photolyase
MEPGASVAKARFGLLDECRKAGCVTNVMLTPVLPFINDTYENFEGIYALAATVGVKGVSAWPLNLRGNTKQKFFNFLEATFPQLLPKYRKLYPGSEIDPDYWDKIKILKDTLRQKYNLPGIQIPPAITQQSNEQLSLF